MKVIVKNVFRKDLKLLDFGSVEVKAGGTVEVEATEQQIQEIKNTPRLELVSAPEKKKKKGDEK